MILPIGLLVSAILGAGMFSLPFVFHQVGLTTGLFYLVCLTIVVAVVHLMYGDIILRTSGHHNFVGYARIYLGKLAADLAILMTVLEMMVVLVIYITLSVSFLRLLVDSNVVGAIEGLIFWLSGSVAVFWSLKKIAWMESLTSFGLFGAVLFIFWFAVNHNTLAATNYFFQFKFSNFLLPIGPVLFALSGRIGVMEVIKYFAPARPIKKIKKIIIWGTIIPAAVYALFAAGVLMLAPNVTEDGIGGLVGILPPILLLAIGVFGILELWTSYVAVGADVYNILRDDLRVSKKVAHFLIISLPLAFYLFNFGGLIFWVSLAGGVFLALEGIFITVIWLKINRWSGSWLVFLVFLVFIATFLSEIWKLFAGKIFH